MAKQKDFKAELEKQYDVVVQVFEDEKTISYSVGLHRFHVNKTITINKKDGKQIEGYINGSKTRHEYIKYVKEQLGQQKAE